MSRTLRGNLTGKAARLDRMDALEAAMERTPFSRRWHNAIDTLRDLMGEEKFDEWYDSYPENMPKGQFVIVMEAQIKNLSISEQDADALRQLLESGEQPHPAEVAYAMEKAMGEDGRNAVENEQIKATFGNIPVTTGAEWRKRHLHQTEEEREEARQNAEMLRALR